MRTIEIKALIFEPGDILDISNIKVNRGVARGLEDAKRALVVHTHLNKAGGATYKVICNNGKVFSIKTDEQEGLVYIGNVDLLQLFEREEEELK